ncbi:MAG: beta-N-acetylhexosaminidase, partial [Alistipes ihumii]|nr:beta-N-acetylhexosaminidase [Alistipes ihumii]
LWAAAWAAPEVNIVPKPLNVEMGDGSFTVDAATVVTVGRDASLRSVGELFAAMIEPVTGRAVKVKTAADGAKIDLAVDPELGEEEYELRVTPAGADVRGGSPKGVLYGLQSLRQLVIEGEGTVPAVTVKDKPYFGYRGAMLDVCRHFMPVEDVKAFIDILAMHKINRFHWHLTEDHGWRIEIKKYPELTRVGAFRDRCDLDPAAPLDSVPYGGFYTQDEVKEIVRYATDRFITVIPEIEMPGHSTAALASYPYLGCRGEDYKVSSVWGVKEDVYCAGNDSTFAFLEGVLTEVVDLFPSEYIHIGGDECPKVRWKACPKCQKRIRDEKLKDEFELQSYFVQRMEKFLNGKGRKIVGWDEIMEGGLSKTATVMSWRGAAGGIEAAKSGNHVIMAPNTHCYLDYYPTRDIENEPRGIGGFLPIEMVYALDPYEGLNAHEREYILGVQGNLWTEFIAELDHAEYMLLPRLAAIAEVGWSYDRKDYPDFYRRMASLRKQYDINGYDYGKHMFAADSAATAPAGR